MTIEITSGNQSVKIIVQDGTYRSRVWVNGGQDATLVSAKHNTEAGARRWAAKELAR